MAAVRIALGQEGLEMDLSALPCPPLVHSRGYMNKATYMRKAYSLLGMEPGEGRK